MSAPYEATLSGCPALSAAQRQAVQQRFIAQLEQLLGGQEGVIAAYGEDEGAFEAWDAEAGPDTAPMPPTRYELALRQARALATAGLPAGATITLHWLW